MEGRLWNELSHSTSDLELMLVRAGQAAGAMCLMLSVFMTYGAGAKMGPTMALISVGVLAFYTAAHAMLVRGIATRQLQILLPSVETLLPSAILAAMAVAQGPAYALGSWVPPQLFAFFLLGSILRLRVDLPIIMGVVASLSYALVCGLLILPMVDDDQLLHKPSVQVVRVTALLALGVVVSLGVRTLKRSIGVAGRSVRSKDLFGKYRLGKHIASGGMGKVVEALYCPEGGFRRRVAVKVIHPHLASDRRFVDRFRQEAELCSRLHHPGIVAALDFGRAGDTWFFVMEFVDGVPLSQLLTEHRQARLPLDPSVVIAMGLQLADALDHAHARSYDAEGHLLRVLHRDLSPSNVLVDRSGQLKISDFGVARALRAGDSLHTMNLVGKPSYVAPEALRNLPIDERSDLWSLAVLLWEALCNQRLFKRANEAATLLAVLEDPPPILDDARPGLGAAWQLFFDIALHRDPERRYPSAAAFRDALLELQRVSGQAGMEEIATLVNTDGELPLDPTESVFER